MTAVELAQLKALVIAEEARQSAAAVGTAGHDNRIGTDGGAPEEENPMCRIKLYRDRDRWRVRIIDTDTKKSINHVFATEKEEKAAIPKLRREHQRPVGVTLVQALAEYRGHLTERGNRARTIDTTLARIQSLLGALDGITGTWTPNDVKEAWERYVKTPTRARRVPSTDRRHPWKTPGSTASRMR